MNQRGIKTTQKRGNRITYMHLMLLLVNWPFDAGQEHVVQQKEKEE